MTIDEGVAVLTAAILAILGIFYTSRQQRKAQRKQHTFQVIDRLNGYKELDTNVEFAAKLLREGRVPRLCDDASANDCEKIDFVLNYYEFLACAIICGDVDEELVRRMEQSRLTRSYLQFIPYIEENRRERKTEGLWENLEFVAYRWTSQQDPFETLIEGFALRPLVYHLENRREEIAEHLKRERQKL